MSIAKVRLLGAVGGYVVVEWVLDVAPGAAWTDAFSSAEPTRRGSTAFLLRSGGPTVRPDGTIRWNVPHADISGAVSFVIESVVFANSVRPASGSSNGRDDRVVHR